MAPIVDDLLAQGMEANRRGDASKSQELYQYALAEARRLKDARGEATALMYLGSLARMQDRDLRKARRLLSTSLRIFTRLGFDRGRAFVMTELGSVAYEEGKPDEGMKWLADALPIMEQERDKKGKATLLHQMGLIDRYRKDPATAEKRWRESLLIFEALGVRYSMGQVLLSLAKASIEDHQDKEQGRVLIQRALAQFEELGLPREAERARHNLKLLDTPRPE